MATSDYDDDGDLVPPHVDAQEADGVGVEEGREVDVSVAVPQRADPHHDQQEADGGHHLEGGRGPFEDPREELESEPLDGREHEEAQCRGIRPWHPVLGVEEIEDEDGHGGDGPVGEVEDPRRLVRQHQTDAGQAVDGSGSDTDHDERKKLRHDCRMPPVLSCTAASPAG